MKEVFDNFTKEWIEISDNDWKELRDSRYWKQRYTKTRNPIVEVLK